MNRLREVMMLLISNSGPLGAQWLDHELKGNWRGHRECHVGGDFLLVYKSVNEGKAKLLIFVSAGTHADLFSE
jgi:mRNA interferase YafQ